MDKKVLTQNQKLERLHQFANKGGIGKCVATQDTIANSQVDLMFYTGEIITVLKHIKEDIYLGYCEGVIGRFRGKDVSFYNPLKSSNSLKPGDHLSDEIISSDSGDDNNNNNLRSQKQLDNFLSPEQAIQMRSRASSISSIDIDSGRNSPCSPVPSLSKSTIPSSINDDVNGNSSQTWTNTKDIENSLNNNNVLSSTSSSLNSNNLDGSLASQKKTSLISNDQSKLPPLSFNGNSQKAHYNQDNQDVQSLKNSPRKMSISPSIQLDQSFNPRRKNSAPLISNNEIQINSGSFRKNSAPTTLIDKGKLMRKTSHDDIGSQISFGSTIYVPTKSDNNKTATSSDSSPNSSINSIQRTQDLEPTTPMTPRTPVSPTSFLNVGPPQPTPTQVPNPDRPVIIKPPVRKSSIIPDSLQNYEKRPQENIRSVSGRNSPSLPASPTSPIISKPKIQLNSSGISNKGNPTNQHDRSTSPIPQICIDKQDMNIHLNNVVNRNNNSSNKPVPSSQSIPLIKVVDSDSYESDFGIKKAPGSANDFSPPMPAFMIEAANDISGNESEDLSSEDEDDSDEKFLEDNNRTSQSKKDKVVAIDEYGFVHNVAEEEIPEGADGVQRIVKALGSSERNSRTIRLYREREAKWVSILANMDPTMSRGSKKIKKLVRLGIPESVRGKSWQLLAGVHKYRQRGVYDDLCKRENLPIYDVIERDIRRCYPDHIQFREDTGFGQDDLHNILRAYAHYNQSVGYCQGMGRLVGMMLMQMPAEDTFWLLVATIEEYMVGYFTPTLSQVRIDSIVFKHLLFEHDPKLAQHLADNDIVPLTYTTQWFMTIFTMALPWASVLRVWDIFYLEGVKFFFRVGLAILDCTREHILKSCPSTSEILEFLLHIPPEFLTPNLLLEAAFKIKVKSSTIRRMTKRVSEIESNNSSGTDTPNPIYSVVKDKRNIMKKSKSTDKLRIDGIEFKIIGEGSNS